MSKIKYGKYSKCGINLEGMYEPFNLQLLPTPNQNNLFY